MVSLPGTVNRSVEKCCGLTSEKVTWKPKPLSSRLWLALAQLGSVSPGWPKFARQLEKLENPPVGQQCRSQDLVRRK